MYVEVAKGVIVGHGQRVVGVPRVGCSRIRSDMQGGDIRPSPDQLHVLHTAMTGLELNRRVERHGVVERRVPGKRLPGLVCAVPASLRGRAAGGQQSWLGAAGQDAGWHALGSCNTEGGARRTAAAPADARTAVTGAVGAVGSIRPRPGTGGPQRGKTGRLRHGCATSQ